MTWIVALDLPRPHRTKRSSPRSLVNHPCPSRSSPSRGGSSRWERWFGGRATAGFTGSPLCGHRGYFLSSGSFHGSKNARAGNAGSTVSVLGAGTAGVVGASAAAQFLLTQTENISVVDAPTVKAEKVEPARDFDLPVASPEDSSFWSDWVSSTNAISDESAVVRRHADPQLPSEPDDARWSMRDRAFAMDPLEPDRLTDPLDQAVQGNLGSLDNPPEEEPTTRQHLRTKQPTERREAVHRAVALPNRRRASADRREKPSSTSRKTPIKRFSRWQAHGQGRPRCLCFDDRHRARAAMSTATPPPVSFSLISSGSCGRDLLFAGPGIQRATVNARSKLPAQLGQCRCRCGPDDVCGGQHRHADRRQLPARPNRKLPRHQSGAAQVAGSFLFRNWITLDFIRASTCNSTATRRARTSTIGKCAGVDPSQIRMRHRSDQCGD